MYKVEVIVKTKDEGTRLADELLKRHFNTHDEFNAESIKVTVHKMVTVSNPTQRGKIWLAKIWSAENENTKGNGMKEQRPLIKEELLNKRIVSSIEGFESLVRLGFAIHSDTFKDLTYLNIWDDYEVTQMNETGGDFGKQAYFHKGNFYNEPYQEETLKSLSETTPFNHDTVKFVVNEYGIEKARDVLDFSSSHGISPYSYMDAMRELTITEQKEQPHKLEEKELTYGETIKQPFPEYEDIEKDKGISMPPWLTHNLKSGLSDIDLYAIAKTAYESGLDVTWKLSSKDPHAEIKAQHEEALKKYDVVKVFCRDFSNDEWAELSGISWTSPHYRIRFYNIDWNKLLSWSYANGEFIECEFSNYKDFSKISEFGKLKVYDGRFARGCYDYCRIAKGVEIKEEWLVEQKESNA